MNDEEIKKIARAARIKIGDEDIDKYRDINDILHFVAQIDTVDTENIDAMSHPLNISQRLREDTVTEINQRDILQSVAPHVEAGVYLVPQVIEE